MYEIINISLTGPNSHSVKLPLRQENLSIGLLEMNKEECDIRVDRNLPINWHAFDEFETPAGGGWPRYFDYYGNDTGFIEWSKNRAIDSFSWFPNKPFSINLDNIQIENFSIYTTKHPIKLMLNHKNIKKSPLLTLTLSGNIENFEIVSANLNPDIDIEIKPNLKKEKSAPPYQLPILKGLENFIAFDINVQPFGQAFDCESLLQFPKLIFLSLTGNLVNTNCLEKLTELESLSIRYAPNLENFPPLDSWHKLKSFIGWNIDAITGKRLKIELRQLAKTRKLEGSSVSQLKTAVWFTTEYGMPFTNWTPISAKTASQAYEAAVKAISYATTEKEVKAFIVEFVEIINKLINIKTEEREDVWTAITQLIEASTLDISHETANAWFDETRDF